MKAAATKSSSRTRTIREAAGQIGVEKRVLKNWLRDFAVFDRDAEKNFTDENMLAARALKRLLVEEHYSVAETKQLIADVGLGAVIAAYGAPPATEQGANPALALQAAVRSAAAAGFFGAVVAELNDAQGASEEDNPVASYAQARLARLTARQ